MKSYTALESKRVKIPEKKMETRILGQLCRDFIREDCIGLCFDKNKMDFIDEEGKNKVPYNFERDVDRICFENAIHRFLQTGIREDAFDVYFCYSEIFKPFGSGYKAIKTLLETLSEHEENSSSLLMKHRDHYSHSVYVFLLGIALYKGNEAVRRAYNKKYNLKDGPEACNDFLEKWGMTSLFHDIGYPFEIAHQQIKTYVCQIVGIDNKKINDVKYYAPFVSYKRMEEFVSIPPEKKQCVTDYFKGFGQEFENINSVFTNAICERLNDKFAISSAELYQKLDNRAVNSQPYMDHAYFSGIILFKRILNRMIVNEKFDSSMMDILISIILHNSMFKFELKGKEKKMSLNDGQPLAYLLMLCDELQCWDRTAYGQNSRQEVSPYDFDFTFHNSTMVWNYYFDESYMENTKKSKSYKNMSFGYKNKKGEEIESYKFVDDINEIIELKDLGEVKLNIVIDKKKKKTKQYASNTKFLNLYDFALALNERYNEQISYFDLDKNIDEMQIKLMASFDKLSLEFKLSNISQAKGFAKHLEAIDCFYTDRTVDYEIVDEFTREELDAISKMEHDRWYQEKIDMGWVFGNSYKNGAERAIKRQHKDLVEFEKLSEADVLKDSEPMRCMIKLLNIFDGLRIYRLGEKNE